MVDANIMSRGGRSVSVTRGRADPSRQAIESRMQFRIRNRTCEKSDNPKVGLTERRQ